MCSKQLVYSTTSRSDARDDRDYQIAANKLLGSVTLGPLLGMGSFGRVYKGAVQYGNHGKMVLSIRRLWHEMMQVSLSRTVLGPALFCVHKVLLVKCFHRDL